MSSPWCTIHVRNRLRTAGVRQTLAHRWLQLSPPGLSRLGLVTPDCSGSFAVTPRGEVCLLSWRICGLIHSEVPPRFKPSPVCGWPVAQGHQGGLAGGGVGCRAFGRVAGTARTSADDEGCEFCVDTGRGGLSAGCQISAGHAPFGGGACASAIAGGGGLEFSTVGGPLVGGLLVGKFSLGRGGG